MLSFILSAVVGKAVFLPPPYFSALGPKKEESLGPTWKEEGGEREREMRAECRGAGGKRKKREGRLDTRLCSVYLMYGTA